MFDTILAQNEDIRSPSPATDDQVDNVGLFLRENHHRMKNTLTLLGAWVRADYKSTASVDLPTAIDGFERRILAFGRLYDLLSNGSDRRHTSVGDYVGSLSRALTVAVLEPKGIRCEAMIGHGFLETKRCERLGLIIVELVTNAAKHAFPNQQSGLENRRADSFVFITGEYNWGIQPGLKNLTDHFLEEWFWRPAAIASYWAGRLSGERATTAWHGTLSEMGMVMISSTITVGPIAQALSAEGKGIGDEESSRFADDLEW
jgi:hypothetical protein